MMPETTATDNKKPWYKRWYGIILWILFWPFMLLWFTWAKSTWKTPVKILATVAAAIGIIISISNLASDPKNGNTANTAAKTSSSQTASNVQDQTKTNDKAPVESTKAATPQPAAVPAEYKSALKQANSYANTMHMSKQGVYSQLTSEYGGKFTAEAAQYAIDNVKSDWNANALAKAKQYQDQQNLSPASIHDQLTSEYGEKFTAAEADYAIANLNK